MSYLQVALKYTDEKFIIQLLNKLGCDVLHKEEKKSDFPARSNITPPSDPSVSPTYLFGKWKHLDLNPRTFRKKLWERNH